jgi:hypothetical protein
MKKGVNKGERESYEEYDDGTGREEEKEKRK